MMEVGAAALKLDLSPEELAKAVYEAMFEARSDYKPADIKRFWKFVDRKSENECWMWKGALKVGWGGYGKFGIMATIVGAHISSWEIHHKKSVPKGMTVCHSCDTPACVNPHHLWIGTTRDNLIDMWKKGRARPSGLNAKGSRNSQSLLSETQVLEIKRLIREGQKSLTDIGKLYGASVQTISQIKRGIAWSHVQECDNAAKSSDSGFEQRL